MKMTVQLALNSVATLAILMLAAWLVYFLWTNSVDWKKVPNLVFPEIPIVTPTPSISYGITSHDLTYSKDTEIHGTVWRLNYSYHTLTVVNNSESDIENIIISLHFPGAIVTHSTQSSVNTFGLNVSQFVQPLALAVAGQPISRFEHALSNSTDISIKEMNKHSTLTLGFVLDYRNKPQGFWQFDLSYQYRSGGDEKRERVIHPIKILKESPLAISIDASINYVGERDVKATADIYPMNPLISTPDGRFVQMQDFDGDLQGIRTPPGAAVLFSQGFDFTVNTDKQYR
jgi:hypothetical protein